ncbi:hypothetical protein PT974_06131 [Cladobotryum mycophilum]|uniref:CENP-V/GFA domain-containing protein n=1 Tax=Cladobotryum mycophilum TaxID=491253 RepID=A0ABR0SLM6_9HYPO
MEPPDDSPRAKIVESESEVGEDGKERLRAECHCGGVSFTIKRPTKEVLDDEFLAAFVYPDEDKTKWFATFDLCNDCRLVDGTHVIGWTFLPTSFCEPHIKSDLKIGTTKTYSTSPGVLRGFCDTCGATVFFSIADRNLSEERHVIDVAVGILRAPEGYMAENWIGWRSRLAFADDGKGFDKDFAEALEEGMKKYVIGKIGKELTMNIG